MCRTSLAETLLDFGLFNTLPLILPDAQNHIVVNSTGADPSIDSSITVAKSTPPNDRPTDA